MFRVSVKAIMALGAEGGVFGSILLSILVAEAESKALKLLFMDMQ